MEGYAIYLTIVLMTREKIDVGPIVYFDTQDQFEDVLTSDEYFVYLERRFGFGVISKNSICKKVGSI